MKIYFYLTYFLSLSLQASAICSVKELREGLAEDFGINGKLTCKL